MEKAKKYDRLDFVVKELSEAISIALQAKYYHEKGFFIATDRRVKAVKDRLWRCKEALVKWSAEEVSPNLPLSYLEEKGYLSIDSGAWEFESEENS